MRLRLCACSLNLGLTAAHPVTTNASLPQSAGSERRRSTPWLQRAPPHPRDLQRALGLVMVSSAKTSRHCSRVGPSQSTAAPPACRGAIK
ncbi:hypothetical protein WOLCODRAFT_164250, partial [Wolfiporia cocos MD-104 SS10]